MNIKFPKEEIRLIETIRDYILNREYSQLLPLYDDVVKHSKFINQHNVSIINIYFKSLFEMREFEKIICLIEDLKKNDLESCQWYFYGFICLIAKKDLYYAKRFINNSKLFLDESINYLIKDDECNYNLIFSLHSTLLLTIGPCLILINFINELIVESFNQKIDDEYIIMRFFDLLNILYENGIDDEIITIFKETLETLYEIEII